MLFKLNNLQLAIENYSKAIKLNSYYHQAYINLGNLFKSNNLLEDAIKLYKNALTLLEKKMRYTSTFQIFIK